MNEELYPEVEIEIDGIRIPGKDLVPGILGEEKRGFNFSLDMGGVDEEE